MSIIDKCYLNGHWDEAIEEFNHPYQNIRMDRFSCFTTIWSNWSMFEQKSKYIALELVLNSLGCSQVWNFKVATHWFSTWVTELLDGRGSLRIWRKIIITSIFVETVTKITFGIGWFFRKFTFGIGLQSEASLRAIASFTWSLLHLQLELALNP